ncbi:MAG: MBL fold metallo-hydrolase [Firmicutes bacterium]|nr:MBL fold metallo-hydrolase [Bacillota bacterium]
MQRKRFFMVRLIVFIMIVTMVGVGFVWQDDIETFMNTTILGNERPVHDVTFDGGLSVHFISVGQGDAVVVEFPNGQIMIVDAGTNTIASRNAFSHYLTSYIFPGNTPRVVDYFVATHSHADHIGAASYLVNNYYVGHVIRPKSFTEYEITNNIPFTQFGIVGRATRHSTIIFRNFIQDLNAATCVNGNPTAVTLPYVGREMNIGGAVVTFFSPIGQFYGNPANAYHTQNNPDPINQLSTIFAIYFEGRRIMFTGDAYVANENAILALRDVNGVLRTGFGTQAGETFKVDVLDVGHHGSHTSTGQPFLDKIQPTYAIIQVGTNTHGHPHAPVMNRLNNANVNILQTKEIGDILVQVSATGQLKVAGVIHDDSFWIQYWMVAVGLTVIIFLALFTVDFIGKKGGSNAPAQRKQTNNRRR